MDGVENYWLYSESQAFILEVFCVYGGVVGQRKMGGELLVAKSWSSDLVFISYSVDCVYPTKIKGHFMVSLILPPVTISTTILPLNGKLRCSSCSPFIIATRGYKLYLSVFANARNNGKDIHVACRQFMLLL